MCQDRISGENIAFHCDTGSCNIDRPSLDRDKKEVATYSTCLICRFLVLSVDIINIKMRANQTSDFSTAFINEMMYRTLHSQQ